MIYTNDKNAPPQFDYDEGILGRVPLGLILFTEELYACWANAATDIFLEKPQHMLLGESLENIIPAVGFRERFRTMITSGSSQHVMVCAMPGAPSCKVSLLPVFHDMRCGGDAHASARLLMILEDVTQREPLQQSPPVAADLYAIRRESSDDLVAMSKLSSAIEQTADSVVITDSEGTIEYVNPAYERLTGFSRAEAIGKRPNLVKSGRHSEAFYKRLWQTIRSGHVFTNVFVNQTRHGTLYYEDKTITPLRDKHGLITHFVSTGKDVTERMKTEQHLEHLAHHDALTDLPNRTLFIDRFKQALGRATRHDYQLAVLFLDLDRFKLINDTLGHDAGDALLQAVSGRLTGHIRAVDSLARFGGDEFALLLENVAGVEALPGIAQDILDALKEPFIIAGNEINITTSIGISLYPEDGCDPQILLKNADTAMYRAKAQGKNKYCFYTADMNAKANERRTLQSALHNALERDEFVLHYQPRIDIGSGRITAVEALLRWRHPELGLLLPEAFVPLLEETGLIVEVGEWVLASALEQLSDWQKKGLSGFRLAVNLSPVQMREVDFVTSVARQLSHAPFARNAQLLEFEITERMLNESNPDLLDTLRALRALGPHLSLDDFGAGYSSLTYLARIPFETLKLDRSLLRNINNDSADTAVLGAMIAMTRSLNLTIVAEGVETESQLDYLREHGCDAMQGHLFSAALAVDDVTALLRLSLDRVS